MLTVLATDATPGLQIRHAGAWIDVAPRPGAFVVNTGDLLHRWSGGRFRCTTSKPVFAQSRKPLKLPHPDMRVLEVRQLGVSSTAR